MSLAAGKLRHRVRLERLDPVEDSAGVAQDPTTGEIEREWVLVATVWAAIEPLSAREFVQSGAGQSQVSARITLRYRSDLNATWRIVHGSRIYNPEGVLADKDSGLEYVTVPVSEGVNAG
jgi:SPP1 family predicted phage head-tail adaptor